VEKMRSANGHPKAVAKQPKVATGAPLTMPMQKTIPGLLFPLEKRPKDSYKEGARRFGSNRDHNSRKHAGIDLYAPVGTPVRAMADGIVVQVSTFYLGTWAVVVDHGTFTARYGEVQPNTILVKNKQPIKRGQVLAHVGKLSGLNYSMLHLEMYATTESPNVAGQFLSQKERPGFQRREDLINPTDSIDNAVME
jgi:murein DD-endopeptidase MepM/ murein hydrolase activator NlpD